jgi:uncharacterized protein YjbI with pentapeptide repeats
MDLPVAPGRCKILGYGEGLDDYTLGDDVMKNLVNEKRLRKELQEANYFLERYPEDSRRLESVARGLYWLGDEDARAYLIRVAQVAETGLNYHPMRAGNYYRLAGEIEKANEHFEAAYREYASLQGQPNSMIMCSMIEAAFHLNNYQTVVSLGKRLETLEGPHQREGKLIARLALARLHENAELAAEVAEEWENAIRKDRFLTPVATGGFDYWSWYEIALQTKADLEGRSLEENACDIPLRNRKDVDRRRLTLEQIGEIQELQDEEPDLSQTDLSGLNLHNVDLTGANFWEADLTEVDLSGALLEEVNLREAILVGANLRGAELPYSLLEGANLERADLSGADLTGADLTSGNLVGTKLTGANLSEADLSHADLRGADLSGADLRRADLSEADLQGALTDGTLR